MFDTLKYSRILEAVGVTRDQAEAHIKIIAEIVEDDLATKQDIRDIRNDLILLEHRLLIKVTAATTASISFVLTVAIALFKLL